MRIPKGIRQAAVACLLVVLAIVILSRIPKLATIKGLSDVSRPQAATKETLSSSVSPGYLQKPGGPYEPRDPRWKEWNAKSKADPGFEWRMPIAFYGKVVDEQERPIQGAKLEIVGTDASLTGNFRRTLYSDANGIAILNGVRGKGFGILVSKEGYYTPQSNRRSFEYAAFFNPDYYQADPKNPVIFHLRKKGNTQALIYRRELRGFLPDGQPSYIDLVTGGKTRGPAETGDLKITISRSPAAEKPFDWSVKVEPVGPGSGVVEASGEFMLEAPENGYQSSIEYSQNASDPNWHIETSKRFYVRSRNGQVYARIEATIIPKYQDTAAIDWQYYVNTTGSRNLESGDEKAAPAP